MKIDGRCFWKKGGVFSNSWVLTVGYKRKIDIVDMFRMAGTITGEVNLCRDMKRILFTVPEIRGASSYIWTQPNGIIDTSIFNETIVVCDSTCVAGNIKVHGHTTYGDGNESIVYVTINEVPPDL
jgi:hypothetical protein